ncbi:phage tail protein [Pseudomonas sp. Marseille-P9655]|uniref:phage tail protein n=1 Tax=Pseudomonas sp. Marseille-P9655 TaxID=2866591 RepID=UPI001CE4AD1D|nr:phage tail protein [Pseudomonas sp. Marseille-P9655]
MGQALKRAPRRATAASKRQVVGSKGGSAKQKQPSIASNSVPSIATVRMLYLWSWGPIVGPVNGLRSVKLDGTPVMAEDGTLTYPGVKWQFRSGELNQERMTGISESSNEIAVGQQLLSTTPYVYTITNSMLDAVRLRFSWPQLQSQDSGGNIDGVRIEYAVDVSTDNGPFQQVLASEVNRKNVTKYERSHRIDLPAGSRWAIRARRITPEANSSLVQDGMYVEAIAEVVDSDQEYPLTAVSCVEYDAEQFGGDIAKIAVLMRGRIVRVPMNYDPVNRTYSTSGPGTTNGVWDGTFKEAYTNNPAWVFFDLALHPYYGLGDRIDATMINRWSLYRIGQYCDQLVPNGLGGQEPRFTCNLYLQKQAEAWAVLQDLAAIFHGLAFWDGSQITVNADMPQDPVYNYTLSQILDDGAVKYTGSKLRDRHSQAMVSFDDPDRGYDTDKEPVFDESAIAEYGVREISVEAVGCTSRGQAQRAGQWALMTEQLQLRGASFRVGLDGYIPKPGKVITLSDPMLAGRANGGRIAAVAGRVVTVDRDIEVPTGARLLVNLPSGKSEARQVRSVAGRQITVMADFSEVPQPESGWVLDFDDLKLMQFYVRNVTRPEWHQFQLECIQYEPSKFDAIDYGTVIDDRPISVLPPGVQDAPARVLIGSHSSVDQGMAVTTMTISWDAAPGAVAYDVEWRWGSRDWVKVPRTGELAADVRGVYAGQYLARVRAVSSMDVSSIPTTSMLTNVAGKTTPPPAVTYLDTESLLFGIKVTWGFPAGAEDTQRTELWYSEGTDLGLATKLADLAYPQNEHVMQGLRAGQRFFFWARLVDRTGNLGPFFPVAPTVISGTASADASPILEQIAGEILESHLGKELTDRIDLIDKNGPGSVNDRIGTAKTELAQQISEVNNALNTTKGNLQQQITAVSVDVSAAKADLQQQIANVSALAGSLPYRKDKAYSVGQSALGSDGKLYQALKAVPLNTPPPNATYWTDVGQAVVTANGMAARVQTMETKVETLEGATSAQAQQISGLQSSLTTTNGNVSAAQQAAQDAATLAGGKGKVIVQSAAPAVADRLAQNLWIDTTSNANTPKRWSGTAWVAVTDKVATDAAAAAAGALALAQTKADATVVSSLTTRVSDAEGKLTSQATRMDGMQTSIDGKASSQALQQVTTRVAATEDKDKAQDQQLSSQSQALTSLTDSVSKKADASAVQSIGNRVDSAEGVLTSQSSDITQLKNSVGATQPFVAGRSWEFTGSTRGWVATASGSTFIAGPLFATMAKSQSLQCSFTPVLPGAENPYLRIRLRRRNTTRTAARLYWANEDGGLAEARRLDWTISVITTDWQDIELDLSGQAGWAGKSMYAIRLDMMNAADTSGEIDVAYIAVGRRSASASAEAVSSLSNAVTEAEGKLATQGQSIISLQGGLTATNTNVTAAQQAAQAAATAAGAKGEVIYGSAAPAADKRLAQNLWIDTTGNANTPKRWSGTAWVAVTDKVASDAAAAAASALSKVETKADASTVQTLGNKVEQQGAAITAAGEAITGINTSLAQAGGENLLYNPSLDVVSPTTAWLPDGWTLGNSGSTLTSNFVPSTLDPSGKALRLGLTIPNAGSYVDLVQDTPKWPGVSEGQVLTLSGHFRATSGLIAQLFFQWRDASGANISTDGASSQNASIAPEAWQRFSRTSAPAPAGAASVRIIYRIRGPLNGASTTGWCEWDRLQLELGNAMTGWRDNGRLNAADITANAAATSALAGRVGLTESGLSSASNQLTQLDNSIGDIGGENLLYNPAFTKAGGSAGGVDGWETEGPVSTTDTLVTSWINSGEKALRMVATGGFTTSSGYRSLRPNVTGTPRRPNVGPSQTLTTSIFVRGTSGLSLRIFMQWVDAAGLVISAPASPLVQISPSAQRVQYTAVSPSNAAGCILYYRIYSATGAVTAGSVEFARPQLEVGARASGWRDSGQVDSNAIGAVSTAVDGLTSSVSQQGKDINSVSARTTSLENSVDNGSTGLASKASTAALNSVAGRVAATESGLTAQSTSITNLEAKIGTALPFVAGQTWEFTNSLEGWKANTPGATLTAGPQYATVAKYTTIQVTSTFPVIDGAENPLIRIRLRRRNTGRTSAAMYWANEDGGLAEARRFNWPISTSNGDWQDIEFDLSGHAGWNGKKIWAIRLDMYNSGDANGEVDIAYIAAGRRSVAASGRAFDSLSVNVSQQGDKLAAETQRINGLLSSVGDANAAIQNEAKARSDADGALSQQIQSTQSSLGATNASVQQISTAQTGLNNRVNAQFSIKVAVTQSGVYALGGIGVGIQNQNGVLQSVVAVLADQFAVINAAGNGYVSPFAIQGGQVFMNDAFIRDGSIINAKIANGAITSAKIGVAEIDTLRIRGNAVTVPVSASSPGNVLGAGVGQWQILVAVGVQMDEGGFITAQYSCYQGFGSGIRKYQFQMDINGLVIAEGGGDWADCFPNLMGSIGVGPVLFVVTVKWWGENTGVGVKNHNLFAMGTKR